MNDIEKSKAFDSQICDELQEKDSELEKALKEERSRIASLNKDLNALKSVSENATDLHR
jgi:predicted RNase H-like nuclease (RuvC/YqgF family)